ncbi:TRAP transporter small permease [Pollutimonas harenae]|uniref:TRAP transporter small permease protein n=1 Tax=Pollutimonas harenae TaxID=657015 RepID=A0A853GRR2_9BURK|nr:TRAP transporter small permease [Pollutimonas harenae]NYT84861.1 TRAP transporter small permease [Pollutimonas harenae]TEA72741.1 TRAP transporter small permease [Pollutimonas harenae]
MNKLNAAISAVLKAIAVLGLCGMSLLTVVDAGGRYLLNHPIIGSVELIELMMVAVIFSSIPLMTRARGHIVVDSFSHFFPKGVRRLQDRIAALISLLVSGVLAWITLHKAQTTAGYGDITAMLGIPLAPFVYFMAILLALDAIYHAVNLVTGAKHSQEVAIYD